MGFISVNVHRTTRCIALLVFSVPLAIAQGITGSAPRLITQQVSESELVTLKGNVAPLARPEFDRGTARADLPMERMLLVLKRSPQQQAALDQLSWQQQDKSSPNYHRWLTPEQFGQQFGLSDTDLQTVTSWLEFHGFQALHVSNGRTFIEFSGTAAQVQEAFHTPIHKYVVNGVEHWANATDPQLPAAFASAVAGVASLHNFTKHPQARLSPIPIPATVQSGSSEPLFTSSNGSHALAPADFATIYNISSVYQSGINGSGIVIAVVGRTNINVQDVVSFRSIFGLSSNAPNVIVNGTNPGDLGGGEEMEAVLDVTWAGAVAPGAHVDLVVSKTTNTSDGVDLSEAYIIDNNLANVMTESFGDCEANYSSAQAASISSLAQQAAAEGITYMVSAGDAGSAGCDNFDTEISATGPVSVNILASTPYTIAVGGTQFYDNTNPGAYWNTQNGGTFGSALSYIPEDVWNANCTGSACGTGNILAGGGGKSQFFTKPSWQTGVAGIPADGARDVPDVALAAAGHTPYLLCLDGSCTPNSQGQVSFYGVYGTSAAAPSFAGIMALVNQRTASRQGQAAQVLYRLAATESLSSCNASNPALLPASACIFNDVTVGTNAVPGEANYNTGSETYPATTGFDRASGLGSVNVSNLLSSWNTENAPESITAFPTGTVPPNFHNDPKAVELGVKIRSDIAGYITSVRFYKNSGDTSAHTGSLWSASGQLLATGTFTNESASGWQQLNFSTPVAVAANTTYVASYHTGSGYYTSNYYFANEGVNNGTLHELQAGVDGPDGVYYYGSGGIFPTQTWESSNYWVDVVFSQTAPAVSVNIFMPGTVPYSFYSDPRGVELGVKIRSEVAGYITGVRFYKNSADSSAHSGSLWSDGGQLLATGTFSNESASGWQQLNFSAPVPIAANTTYVASYHTSSGYYTANSYFANQGVNNGTLHGLQNGGDGPDGVYYYGSGGVFPTQTWESSNYWVDVVFSQNATHTAQSTNIFAAGTVPPTYYSDPNAVELAVKFRSDLSGHITGIRFYKNPADTHVHTGSLWSDSGQLLATGTFANETPSGWQQLNFSTPVAIVANATYTASYHTSGGFYSSNYFFANHGVTNGTLHALEAGVDGPDGVYYYGPGGVFPTQTWESSNYWVDVVFSSP